MKLIYLSTDEMNQALVRTWAGRKGVPVECPSRLDPAVVDPRSAVLIDLDHMPPSLEGFVMGLGGGGAAHPVVAHGYGPQGDVLRGRGLAVHTRLRSQVLADLTSTALSLESAPAQDASDELTWVNLV